MKAIICREYGSPDVLELREVGQPVAGDHEVLIKIHAASVNAGDWHLMRGEPLPVRLNFGLTKPKFPTFGSDIAGRVEAVGPNVTRFQPGDEVFADVSGCGMGAFAEYAAIPEEAVVGKPSGLTFEEAAAAPMAGSTALQGLHKGKVKPGERVLINGASGGVGTFAVQIAKALGAEVTAVCSTRNLELARSIGADQVIDYTKENFTRSGKTYDVILALNGYHPISDYKRSLNPGGRYVMTGGANPQFYQAALLGPLMSMAGSRKLGVMLHKANREDLGVLKGLLEEKKVVPVIDRRYSLAEVPEAMAYVEKGHARGKVVITVADDSAAESSEVMP